MISNPIAHFSNTAIKLAGRVRPKSLDIFRVGSTFYNERNFKFFMVGLFVLMVGISPQFGINGDERFQVDYSKNFGVIIPLSARKLQRCISLKEICIYTVGSLKYWLSLLRRHWD